MSFYVYSQPARYRPYFAPASCQRPVYFDVDPWESFSQHSVVNSLLDTLLDSFAQPQTYPQMSKSQQKKQKKLLKQQQQQEEEEQRRREQEASSSEDDHEEKPAALSSDEVAPAPQEKPSSRVRIVDKTKEVAKTVTPTAALKKPEQIVRVPRMFVEHSELPDCVELLVHLAQVKPEDVQLTVEQNCLTIGASRSIQSQGSMKLVESFERKFLLPDGFDANTIEAQFDEAKGSLLVTIPKPKELLPKKINIRVNKKAIESAEEKKDESEKDEQEEVKAESEKKEQEEVKAEEKEEAKAGEKQEEEKSEEEKKEEMEEKQEEVQSSAEETRVQDSPSEKNIEQSTAVPEEEWQDLTDVMKSSKKEETRENQEVVTDA